MPRTISFSGAFVHMVIILLLMANYFVSLARIESQIR
ncbi:MAG: hypothetical protein H6Q20_1716 [Bacteroidetes bacterium]|jgi:hypothetical protein|nr:hypothetical protein [Bacteroidota bacterium]